MGNPDTLLLYSDVFKLLKRELKSLSAELFCRRTAALLRVSSITELSTRREETEYVPSSADVLVKIVLQFYRFIFQRWDQVIAYKNSHPLRNAKE